MLKNFQVGFFSPSTELLVGTKYLFSDEGRFAFKKKKNLLVIWLTKWKRKTWLHANEFWSKIGTSHRLLIIRSKLNLLTEPENKSKHASSLKYFATKCKFYLFSSRNIFKKKLHFALKNDTRWHEGFKLPLFMYYANSGQFYGDRKKFFLRLLSAIFVPYFFSFAFVIMASTFFHDAF